MLQILKEHEDKINDYEPEYIYDITAEIKDNDECIHESEFCFNDDDDDDEELEEEIEIDIQKIFQIFSENRRINVIDRKKSTEKIL